MLAMVVSVLALRNLKIHKYTAETRILFLNEYNHANT